MPPPPSRDPRATRRPAELLAPAGNWECARAAVANGADAIYFGLPRFNTRMRADNFSEDELPGLMAFLHEHGVRGFAAFNTLVFTAELEAAAAQLALLEAAGVDAVIVQDLGLATMARALAPGLDLHASTQMTITSPEGLAFAHGLLGLDRAVIARENSMREIRLFRPLEPGAVELETFVHGALCVAYSGQCLTSESLGQRSANRGECAQACRMPYELVVDGETRELGDRRYLLSPQDLAGIGEIPELLALGVISFKIEGRLKTPEYVAAVTRAYRAAIDEALAASQVEGESESDGEGGRGTGGAVAEREARRRYELEMAFSRGLSSGWLRGIDNQRLVHARFGKKRGACVGELAAVGPRWVEVSPEVPVAPGDGLVFDTGGDTEQEQGGRVYAVDPAEGGRVRLAFARGKIDFSKLKRGDRVWKTDDPALNAELRRTWKGGIPPRRLPLAWRVEGRLGEPLRLVDIGSGLEVRSEMPLAAAERRPLDAARLREQLSRLGGSRYRLDSLDVALEGGLICPVSELNRLRRELVEQLDAVASPSAPPTAPAAVALASLLPERTAAAGKEARDDDEPQLAVLCRDEAQVEAALACGAATVYVDLEDVRRCKDLVARAKAAYPAARIYLATPRIQKAGESGLFRLLERARPDGFLVRNLGGLGHFLALAAAGEGEDGEEGAPGVVADFSLNIANPVSARRLAELGCEALTVSYDLDLGQVLDLLRAAPPQWFELTLHQHMPMFHMEHCVFCAFLSEGKDFTDCGRPCDRHRVELRDRVGQRHPLAADVGCRNTLFNGRAQSGARYYGELAATGLRRYRVELLREDAAAATRLVSAYQSLLRGDLGGDELLRQWSAVSRLGVVEGTLAGAALG